MQDNVLIEAVGRDAVACVSVACGQVEHQLGSEVVVNEVDVMGLLHLEVGIAVAEGGRVGIITVGIEIRDARAADAHIVAQADVGSHSEIQLEGGRRHKASVVGAEGAAAVLRVVLPGVLVACAGLHTYAAEVYRHLGICCTDAVVIIVIGAAGFVEVPAASVPEVVHLVREVVTGDVFGSGGEGADTVDGRGEVGLDGVVYRVGLSVGPAVREVEHRNIGLAEKILAVRGCRTGREQIGQDETAVGMAGPKVLIVRTGRYGCGISLRPGICGIAEPGTAESHGGEAGIVACRPQAHEACSSRNEVEAVDIVTEIEIAQGYGGLHRSFAVHRGRHPRSGRALDVDGGSGAVVQHGVAGQAHGELAFLLAVEDAGPAAAGGGLRRDGAVGSLRCARAARDLADGGDLKDTAYAFRVIADARVGDDRDVLDRAGGHHLEDYGRICGDHLVGFAIHVDLERGAAVHRDVVLSVD